MPQPKELTLEQKSALFESAHQCLVWFRARHKDADGGFHYCPENVDLMSSYIKLHKLAWTQESLAEAYEAVKERLIPAPEVPDEEPEVQAIVEEPCPYPFGVLSRERVRDMEASEIRRWMTNKDWGDEFKRQLDALQLTRSDLRSL